MARTSPDCRRMPEHLTLSHDSTPHTSPTVRDVLMVLFSASPFSRLVLSDRFLFGNRVCDGDPQVPSIHASAGSTRPLRSAHDAPAKFSGRFLPRGGLRGGTKFRGRTSPRRRGSASSRRKNGLVRPGLLASLHVQQEDVHAQVERASRKLAAQIIVEPIRKTSLIQVHYRSSDPAQAARVLNSLAAEYSTKHAELHRPSGELEFFDQQISNSRLRLDEAEAALLQFTQREGYVAAPLERDAALVRLADAEAKFRQLRQDISQSEQRVRTLHQQMIVFPPRSTSTIRLAENSELLETLKSAFWSFS